MNLEEYQKFATTTAVYPGANTSSLSELKYLALGLAGESGEVANQVKKLYRDGYSPVKREKIFFELGDVLWYWIRLCDAFKIDPMAVIQANVDKLSARKERGTIGGDGDNR